jgi:hypothetical protein
MSAVSGDAGRKPPESTTFPNSDLICNLVRAASARHGVGFLDTVPALRVAASTELLHGPVDWAHFNAQGYRALGRALVARSVAAIDACE